MRLPRNYILGLLAGLLWLVGGSGSGLAAAAQLAAKWIASPEPGWPQFRGPRRNGISDEQGLLQNWPTNGPRLLWSITNIGAGYSAPIISGTNIYITGDVGDELHIYALDLQGGLVWKATNGAAWRGPYPGSRASCTYAAGRLYHLNAHGRLACFDAATGRPVWHVDVLEAFESHEPTWGMAECVLVDGWRVVVTPGGRRATMAALDRDTGKALWMAAPLAREEAGSPTRPEGPAYAPPILIEVAGRRHIVGMTARHALGVDAETGSLQWTFDLPTRYEVLASSPVLWGAGVFVTGPDAGGGKYLRFAASGRTVSVEPGWTSTLDTCHGGMIPLAGSLYGSWYRDYNGWGSVDLAHGATRFRDRELAMGSVLYADGHLYCLSQTGTLALVKPNPDRWEIISRFEFAKEPKKDVWAHPVILDGRLYLRHQQRLSCYVVKR